MIMYNGESVWPKDKGVPTPHSIGVGLGRIPRFGGQTKHWYPVLAHVMVCSILIAEPYKHHGLLHDAQEACCSDVPTPWKTEAAKKREVVLQRRIYRGLGLDYPLDPDAAMAVVAVDAMALAAEAHVLGHIARDRIWPTYNQEAADLTSDYLKVCRDYLEPAVSGPAFATSLSMLLPTVPLAAAPKG